MTEKEILNNIKQNYSLELEGLSQEQMENLLKTTVNAIDSILENGDVLEIDDFGIFSRRKNNLASVSFFKPVDRLNERINRKK